MQGSPPIVVARSVWLVLGCVLAAFLFNAVPGTPATVVKDECAKPDYDPQAINWQALVHDMKSWLTKNHEATPILLRLSWHDAGTYQMSDDTGGSRAAQRFPTGESQHGANAGLHIARGMVQMFKEAYPNVGLADLWALIAVLAIEEAGGPKIPFRAGRADIKSASQCVEEGRLPDGDKGASHVRKVFNRMGFDDAEIVALSGGHTLGGCHASRSGFQGDWTLRPHTFDNGYYQMLLDCDWVRSSAKTTGQVQMACAGTDLMMLTTDYALVQDPALRKHVEVYAADNDAFRADFAKAFQKLQENGHHFLQDVDLVPSPLAEPPPLPLCNCACGSYSGQCGANCHSCDCDGCDA